MKSFFRTFLLAAIPFGLYWGIFFDREKEFWPAVWSGVIAGTIAGLLVAVVTRYRENRVRDSEPVLGVETLLREARSSFNGMSGRLYLSNSRLFFEGYLLDELAPEIMALFEGNAAEEPVHHISIPLICISDVIPTQKLAARIDIKTTDGRTESFRVEDPIDWVNDILTARQMCLDVPRSEQMKLFPGT